MALFDVPKPLDTAPSRQIWERFGGQDYLVFVDESFYQFFDFSRTEGNFCHGALGIPAAEYDAFKTRFASTVSEYNKSMALALGAAPKEIKHADLYRLPFSFRRKFALRLNGDLLAHGGFIAGFHASNRGFVMEKVREDLVYEADAIPDDHAGLLEAKIRELDKEYAGPGKSDLISRLLNTPIAGITNFLSSFDCHFRMIYDPRQPEEDKAVKTQAEVYMRLLSSPTTRNIVSLNTGGTGLDATRRSDQEIGLQIADIVAGEVRRFFRFNPELLSWGSDLRLVSGESEEELEAGMTMDGVLVKCGRFLWTPQHIQKRYLTPNDQVFLPYLRNSIMSGSLCCITDFGQERIIRLFQGLLFDLCD